MCRVLAYAPSHQWLFVSQPIDNNVHPGYGIKKKYKIKFSSFEYIFQLDQSYKQCSYIGIPNTSSHQTDSGYSIEWQSITFMCLG